MGNVIAFESSAKKAYETLIEDHYLVAKKMAQQILRSWGVNLADEEIESATGIAICQAAKRFRPSHQAKFTTYLHYFIKGALSESISFQRSCSDILESHSLQSTALSEIALEEDSNEIESLPCKSDIDHEVYVKEVRRECNAAIASLSNLEKVVIFEVNVLGDKVATLAFRLGYSRGYLSEVRSRAEQQLRVQLSHLRNAA